MEDAVGEGGQVITSLKILLADPLVVKGDEPGVAGEIVKKYVRKNNSLNFVNCDLVAEGVSVSQGPHIRVIMHTFLYLRRDLLSKVLKVLNHVHKIRQSSTGSISKLNGQENYNLPGQRVINAVQHFSRMWKIVLFEHAIETLLQYFTVCQGFSPDCQHQQQCHSQCFDAHLKFKISKLLSFRIRQDISFIVTQKYQEQLKIYKQKFKENLKQVFKSSENYNFCVFFYYKNNSIFYIKIYRDKKSVRSLLSDHFKNKFVFLIVSLVSKQYILIQYFDMEGALLAESKKAGSRAPLRLQSYRQTKVRFVVLLLASVAMFASMFCFNIMQALEVPIVAQLEITETQFNLLYSVFALPNIVTALFVGVLVDIVGVRLMFILMSLGVALFQALITLGVYLQSYPIILAGRALFGAVSQSLTTAQLSFITFWFAGQELSFAVGVALTFPELGDALNSFATPLIHEHFQDLMPSFYFSLVICLFSVAAVAVAIILDKRADQLDAQDAQYLRQLEEVHLQDLSESEPEQFAWGDLRKFSKAFWLLLTLCVLEIVLYTPFLDNANHFAQDRFGFSPAQAGRSIMYVDLIGVTLSVPLGMLIDWMGNRRYFIIISAFLFSLSHFLFYILPQSENGESVQSGLSGFILLGLCYTFYSNALIPAISLVTPHKNIGTAFGVLLMLESIGLCSFPYAAGLILEKSPSHEIGFHYVSLMYFAIGCLTFVLSFGLLCVNQDYKEILDDGRRKRIIRKISTRQKIRRITSSTPFFRAHSQQHPSSNDYLQYKKLSLTQGTTGFTLSQSTVEIVREEKIQNLFKGVEEWKLDHFTKSRTQVHIQMVNK